MTTPLLYNRIAGRGKLDQALAELAGRHSVELVPVSGPQDMRVRVAELARTHERLLVAGGDGTVHHAIRGIDGSDATLGIIPGGTGNDFALALGLPTDPREAIERGLTARPVAVDLGRVDSIPFAGIAGIGIVADVLTYLDDFSRRYRGNWVYPWAVLRTVATYRAVEVVIESEKDRFSGPTMIALAANAPRFGGGMRAAPEASMHDGLLDVVILRKTSRPTLVRLLPRVYRGTHLSHPACRVFRAARLSFGARPNAVFYADGEALPVEAVESMPVRVDPGRLRVAV